MADRILDCKGLKCPMPIVKIAKEIRLMSSGQILEVQANDNAFKPDVTAWCKMTGNILVSITQVGDVFAAQIKIK